MAMTAQKVTCSKQVSMLGQLWCKIHGGESFSEERLPETTEEHQGGIPLCEAWSIETGERCKTRLTPQNDRTGEGLCRKHFGKADTKRVAINSGSDRFRGQGIRWDFIFVSGVTALLYAFDSDQEAEGNLRRGLMWLSKLAMACSWNGLSPRELFLWFSEESYDCEMTLALLKGMGSEPLMWLLAFHERWATPEQKNNLKLWWPWT